MSPLFLYTKCLCLGDKPNQNNINHQLDYPTRSTCCCYCSVSGSHNPNRGKRHTARQQQTCIIRASRPLSRDGPNQHCRGFFPRFEVTSGVLRQQTAPINALFSPDLHNAPLFKYYDTLITPLAGKVKFLPGECLFNPLSIYDGPQPERHQ